jgi:hypothetical protein
MEKSTLVFKELSIELDGKPKQKEWGQGLISD